MTSAVWDNQGAEYSGASTNTMHDAPHQAVLLVGGAAFGSTDRMDCIELRGHDPLHPRRIWREGRMWSASRWAWTQANGAIPDGLWVLHHCDNAWCIKTEPDERWPDGHLFLGTAADNTADMMAKGRAGGYMNAGDQNGMRRHPERVQRGSRHGMAILTEADIPVIRARLAAGETQPSVAAAFGVSRSAILDIHRRATWSHVR